jgi:riboflavin biosynthesis pyrimidine reductase
MRSAADHVEIIRQELSNGRLDLPLLLRVLRDRGYPRVFVEGGGITVSRFLEASLLDRLHLAIAPTILGSGRSSFALPVIDRLDDRQRLAWRQYRLGPDLLLDCEFHDDSPPASH